LVVEILNFKIFVGMYVAKIADRFEKFDSHVTKIAAKLLVGFSQEITLACFNFVISSWIVFSLAIMSL